MICKSYPTKAEYSTVCVPTLDNGWYIMFLRHLLHLLHKTLQKLCKKFKYFFIIHIKKLVLAFPSHLNTVWRKVKDSWQLQTVQSMIMSAGHQQIKYGLFFNFLHHFTQLLVRFTAMPRFLPASEFIAQLIHKPDILDQLFIYLFTHFLKI